MDVTKEQLQDTEVALSHWWCGTDWDTIEMDLGETDPGIEVTEEARQAAHRFEMYDDMVLELLTLWRGYVDASLGESVQPSVEDFILATYVVNRDKRR